MTNYDDVLSFNGKFKLPRPITPQRLTPDVFEYRLNFLKEELREFEEAISLAGQADALVDLVYVALGTAIMMGLPWQELWDDVQRANMSKERTKSAQESLQKTGRGHRYDIVKPEGWAPPNTSAILERASYEAK